MIPGVIARSDSRRGEPFNDDENVSCRSIFALEHGGVVGRAPLGSSTRGARAIVYCDTAVVTETDSLQAKSTLTNVPPAPPAPARRNALIDQSNTDRGRHAFGRHFDSIFLRSDTFVGSKTPTPREPLLTTINPTPPFCADKRSDGDACSNLHSIDP